MDKLKQSLNNTNAYTLRIPETYYRRVVTFSAPTETLSNFPALVKVSNDTLLSQNALADGSDVYFTLPNGTELAKELDWYDNATGSGAWWVLIPSLSGTSGASVHMRFGDGTTHADNKASLWSSYRAVYHYSSLETFTNDSTGNYNLTLSGTRPTFTTVSTVPTGRALQSSCSSDASYTNTDAYTSGGTLSTYGFAPSTISGSHIFYGCGYGHISQDGAALHYAYNAGGGSIADTKNKQYGWVCSTNAGAGGNYSTTGCYNGTVNSYESYGSINSGNQIFYSTYNWTPGIVCVDEQRITSVVRSNAWIAYEWANMMNHSTTASYGAAERVSRRPL